MSVMLRIAYEGTEFHGFARQQGVRTVQGELERALAAVYKQPVTTRGASRTDAGVHARGQLVAFEAPLEIPDGGLLRALAGELPRDLIAIAAWRAELPGGGSVNPRFHNLGKHYRYGIRCLQLRDPFTDRLEWHLPRRLDLEAMSAGARHFVGEHDFAAFRAADCAARTTRRRVTHVSVRARAVDPTPSDPQRSELPGDTNSERPAALDIDVHGQAFLKNMVRIMVGTLVDLGLGRYEPDYVAELLRQSDRTRAGQTAPGCGLTLVEVKWPASWPEGARLGPRRN